MEVALLSAVALGAPLWLYQRRAPPRVGASTLADALKVAYRGGTKKLSQASLAEVESLLLATAPASRDAGRTHTHSRTPSGDLPRRMLRRPRRPTMTITALARPPPNAANRGGGKAFEEPLVRERFDFPARDALQAAPPRRLRVGACEVADLDAPRPSLGSTLASSRSTAASGTRSRPPAGSRARSSPRSRCRSARFCGLTVLCLYIYICVCVYLLDRSWSYMWSDIYIMLMSDHSWLIDYIYIC